MSSRTDNKSTTHPKKSEPPATLSDFVAAGKILDYTTQSSKKGQGSDKKDDEEPRNVFDHSSPSAQGKGREGIIANNETRKLE